MTRSRVIINCRRLLNDNKKGGRNNARLTNHASTTTTSLVTLLLTLLFDFLETFHFLFLLLLLLLLNSSLSLLLFLLLPGFQSLLLLLTNYLQHDEWLQCKDIPRKNPSHPIHHSRMSILMYLSFCLLLFKFLELVILFPPLLSPFFNINVKLIIERTTFLLGSLY